MDLLVISIFIAGNVLRQYVGGRFSLLAAVLAKAGLAIAGLTMAVVAFYLTREQFMAWRVNDFSKYLIPPYHSIDYFLWYAFEKFWASYVISGSAAFIIFWIASFANARRGGMLFEREELYFLATGMFLTGHPGWILYIAVVLLVYLFLSAFYFLFSSRTERVSFYYWWLPVAALVILLEPALAHYSWYSTLFI